jgi:hypothetical protein
MNLFIDSSNKVWALNALTEQEFQRPNPAEWIEMPSSRPTSGAFSKVLGSGSASPSSGHSSPIPVYQTVGSAPFPGLSVSTGSSPIPPRSAVSPLPHPPAQPSPPHRPPSPVNRLTVPAPRSPSAAPVGATSPGATPSAPPGAPQTFFPAPTSAATTGHSRQGLTILPVSPGGGARGNSATPDPTQQDNNNTDPGSHRSTVQVPSLNSTGTTPPVSVRAYIASPVGADALNKPTQFAAPDIDSPQVQLNADRDQPLDTLPAYLRARYDLGPVLGKGNYAFVREGIDKATNLKIAMKIVDRTQVKPSAELSIKREVHILGMLTHPNIVRTYAIYEEPNCFYTVLECINGGALFDRLKLRTVFTELQVRELAHVLLSAIQHCHERNVVHRYALLIYFWYLVLKKRCRPFRSCAAILSPS